MNFHEDWCSFGSSTTWMASDLQNWLDFSHPIRCLTPLELLCVSSILQFFLWHQEIWKSQWLPLHLLAPAYSETSSRASGKYFLAHHSQGVCSVEMQQKQLQLNIILCIIQGFDAFGGVNLEVSFPLTSYWFYLCRLMSSRRQYHSFVTPTLISHRRSRTIRGNYMALVK